MNISRADIAAALSTVPGITGSALEPPSKAPGQGWPVWRESVVIGACVAYTANWYVFVVLPNGDLHTPPDAADPLALPLAQALHSTGLTVERWEPYQMVLGPDNAIPVLRFTAFD